MEGIYMKFNDNFLKYLRMNACCKNRQVGLVCTDALSLAYIFYLPIK